MQVINKHLVSLIECRVVHFLQKTLRMTIYYIYNLQDLAGTLQNNVSGKSPQTVCLKV